MDSPITRPGDARLSSNNGNSPEFEFWRLRNPNSPQPNLVSADELFVDGVLLPLRLVSQRPPDPPDPASVSKIDADPEPTDSAEISVAMSSSKRWTDIFKKAEKKPGSVPGPGTNTAKEKKREKKTQTGSGTTIGTELNINIWPFSRSRSAGNNATRPKWAGPPTRKVSSAPCSRSNSAGESKSRKWPSSPGRPGVHLGRSSPIWQVKRSTTEARGKNNRNNVNTNVGKVRILNLNVNVPMCIGYRNHMGCRSDESSTIGAVGVSETNTTINGGARNGNLGGANLFGIKNLFAKKVY